MLDSNTYYLSIYEHNQSILEQQWENTMVDKQEAVVELAIKLIKREVDDELFNWVFAEYLDDADVDDVVCFRIDLECIEYGERTLAYSKEDIVLSALEGACQSLYDCELDEITNCGTRGMVNQVLEGLSK